MTRPAAIQGKITVTSATDVIPMVPHLLGFVPQESLVLLCFRGDTLGPLIRVDLPGAQHATELAVRLGDQARQHADRVAVIAYSLACDAAEVLRYVVAQLRAVVSVIEAVTVTGTTACRLPDASHPIPQPTALSMSLPATMRLAADGVLHGRAVLPSRQAVADSIAPPTGSALRQARAAAATVAQELSGAPSPEWLTERADAVLDVSLTALERTRSVPPRWATSLAVLAQRAEVRDLMIATMLSTRERNWIPMLIHSLTQVSADDSPDLSAVLAVLAYRRGDGALARCAADRALSSNSQHRLALLMLQIMDAGLPPTTLDELRELNGPTE